MGRGIFSLMLRSLRCDARALVVHLAWALLGVGLYVSLCIVNTNRMVGAPGLQFLRNIAHLNAFALCLLGTPFFAGSIAEERDEGTLGLMRMAGLGSLGILLGKSAGRLMQTMIIIMLQLPFWWLSITLGGVTQGQLMALFLALVSFTLAVFGLGTLCSVVGSSARSATTMTGIVLGAYFFATVIDWSAGLPGYFATSSYWMRVDDVLTTGFNQSPWSFQAISNAVFGVVCLALSWSLFAASRDEFVTRQGSSGLLRGWPMRHRPAQASARIMKRPLAWKDFQFVLGSWMGLAKRTAFYLGLFLCAGAFNFRNPTGVVAAMPEIHASFQFALIFAIPFDIALLSAASVQSEVRQQTLANLIMLPCGSTRLVYEKLLGILPGIVPGIGAFALSGIAQPYAFFHSHEQFLVLAAWMMSVPHLATALSLYLRWGAVPIAFALMFGFLIGSEWCCIRGPIQMSLETLAYLVVCPFYLFVCIASHMIVIRRYPHLAAR